MKKFSLTFLAALLIPTIGVAENRIDCYSDANSNHTYLTYTGIFGEYNGRLNEPLRVVVTKDDTTIAFQSPEMEWFNYYIDRTNGFKYSSFQLSTDPSDYKWVKIAECTLPAGLAC